MKVPYLFFMLLNIDSLKSTVIDTPKARQPDSSQSSMIPKAQQSQGAARPFRPPPPIPASPQSPVVVVAQNQSISTSTVDMVVKTPEKIPDKVGPVNE